MKKALVLFILVSVLGVANVVTAQTTTYSQGVYVILSDPRPLLELGIPFTSDVRFFANYSPNTAVVYVNKEEVVTVPPNMYVLATFNVASDTKVEAYTSVATNKGTKRVKMNSREMRVRREDGSITAEGWLFSIKRR